MEANHSSDRTCCSNPESQPRKMMLARTHSNLELRGEYGIDVAEHTVTVARTKRAVPSRPTSAGSSRNFAATSHCEVLRGDQSTMAVMRAPRPWKTNKLVWIRIFVLQALSDRICRIVVVAERTARLVAIHRRARRGSATYLLPSWEATVLGDLHEVCLTKRSQARPTFSSRSRVLRTPVD